MRTSTRRPCREVDRRLKRSTDSMVLARRASCNPRSTSHAASSSRWWRLRPDDAGCLRALARSVAGAEENAAQGRSAEPHCVSVDAHVHVLDRADLRPEGRPALRDRPALMEDALVEDRGL